MVAFIYLAYQMMALLYETVPAFTDTWIECLGDLARYRMAIEDDKEVHTLWGGVASRWYSTASDRHPAIGRLYHHLGILEKPSVLKLFLYGKSLTCSSPFQNARDSLLTLCSPIVKGGQVSQNNQSWVEAATLTFYANALMGGEESVSQLSSDAISVLRKEPAAHLTNIGAFITITSIAHLLEFGSTTNKVFQLFNSAAMEASGALPQSASLTNSQASSSKGISDVPGVSSVSSVSDAERTWCSAPVYHHYRAALNSFLDRTLNSNDLPDLLPTIHTILVWLHSIHSLRSRNHDDHDTPREKINMAAQGYTSQALFARAYPGEKPILLPEDHNLRGLLWTQSYHPQGWFDDLDEDEDRFETTDVVHKALTSRVLLLALKLASNAQHLRYDMQSGKFWTPQPAERLGPTPREGETTVKPSVAAATIFAAAKSAARLSFAADSIRLTQATPQQPKHSYRKMDTRLQTGKNAGRDHPRDAEVYEGDFTGRTSTGDYKYEFG
ncbi:hypothetical protein LTR09_012950 [Extremus antarcticus]|uniref:DNA/RNA-binding domain-containing protein n=1 Tax=Extremus antarcticus TaxID=702011 RepID=A0AAJ0D982_9PEZI|nr:hypothetical protein LTR09_012950 [Extremus antarcticus]